MRQETLIHLFRREINVDDLTSCFWYIFSNGEAIHFSETDEVNENPDHWRNGGYSSDRISGVRKRKGYMIATLDDGFGGSYQAIFKEDKEVIFRE